MTDTAINIDTIRISLSANAHGRGHRISLEASAGESSLDAPSLEEVALKVGAELAAVSDLPAAMCSAVVFSALSSGIPEHAVAERVARSLHAPVRV